MKSIKNVLILVILGIFILPSCKKETTSINLPVNLTDKDGNIFIKIDPITKSFDAYSFSKVTKGQLKGIFNDTLRSSIIFALATRPYWDTEYHPADTIVFPSRFMGHSLVINTEVDLSKYSSPYHFLLLGVNTNELISPSYGIPTVLLTIERTE